MNTDTSRVIVRADYLAALQPFISTEETRYYLTGVHIEPHPVKGAILVVTDGNMLAAIHDIDATIEGKPQIWSHDWKAAARSVSKEMKGFRHLNGHVWADLSCGLGAPAAMRLVFKTEAGDESELLAKRGKDLVIDGSFPQWRRVVPNRREDDAGDPHFNPAYVAKACAFAQAIGAASGVAVPAVSFVRMSKNGPSLVRIYGCDHAFLVIMPMRAQTAAYDGPPSWLFEQPEQELAQAA